MAEVPPQPPSPSPDGPPGQNLPPGTSAQPELLGYESADAERPAGAAPTEQQLESESPVGVALDAAHDPYAALRLPAYRNYALGWVFSVVGHQVQSVAVGWELYQRTGTALALGWVGLVQALPVMLLALPAGHLADRFDRRRIVQASVLVMAACSLGLAAVSWRQGPVTLVYALLFLSSVARALGWPARSAMLPQIVPPELFNNAVTWNSSIFHLCSVAGPATGGLVLLAGPRWAYAFDAACAVAFVLLLGGVRMRGAARSLEPATLQSLLAGVRFVWRTKIILATITLDLFAVLFGGAVYLLPVFATDVLGVGSVAFGWLRAAPAAGAFAATLLLAHLPPMRRAGPAMLWSVAGFGVATIVFGLSRWYWLSLAMLALTGALDAVSVIVRHTLVQMLPPDEMRGRVAAVNNVFIGASNDLGGLESGVTAAWWGPVRAVVFGGVATVAVVAGVAWAWPQIRHLGSLKALRPVRANGSEAAAHA